MATANKVREEVRRISARPYTRELVRNEDGSYFGRVIELPGCMTEGATMTEAIENLDEAMGLWIEVRLEDGDPIPEPLTTDQYSGKFVVRIPKTLHRDLARRANIEGVSLNQYVSTQLARVVDLGPGSRK
jgi:predicted RNase H-like HicB family nuclease